MEGLSPFHISAVCGRHLHRLHTFPQCHVLYVGEVGALAGLKPFDEPSQSFFTEDVTGSSTHVALVDEGAEPSPQVHGLLRVELGHEVAKVLNNHECVVVRLQEPVGIVQVVLVDVLEGSDGLPVQVVPPLAHVELHRGEVGLDGAHVEHGAAAPGPGLPDVPGSGLHVLGPRHDPAQDPVRLRDISC